ncbi:MarR family winged helix-turn-helix transcriptional regulator [Microbacterium sp. SORGH_AS_0888]|uniref:MarR family winged helix-turn-helix transcriptional regulator n=1 Tax=Microbacterium sp. SORGH_AS_0888 TaxID=3041791 RepID=UPI0027891056|nr:MarR family winged helix-turn-helix transcriptional regulator [Microbacterium sp. SORGH_AS_0888]MDQ1129623.1 DNA-binding MarR family transcriptional regulator [Microbacterium sp. SORGH_AS_0888]
MSEPAARPVAAGPARLWASTVGSDTSFLLARANALSLQRITRTLAPWDLKVRSYSVLALAAADVRPTQRELSEFLQLDPSQIVALIDALETRGLVTREPDPNDRRANILMCTDAGRVLHAEAQAAVALAESELFEGIDSAVLDAVVTGLRHLAADPGLDGADRPSRP